MPTSAGELRESLISAIDDVKSGKLDPLKARAIAALAGQVNLSLQVELNARAQATLPSIGRAREIGLLPLGEQNLKDIN